MRVQIRLHSLWGSPGSTPVGRPVRHQWAKPWVTAAEEQRPEGKSRPRLRDRVRDSERQPGGTRRGLRDRHGARRSHSPAEDVGQLLKTGCLGRGEDRHGEDDRQEDQELLRAGGRQFERGRNRTAHGIGERRRRGREAAESGGDGQEGG